MVTVVAHIQAYKGAITMRIELWQKLQLLLGANLRHCISPEPIVNDDGEEQPVEPEIISIETLRLLTSVLNAQKFGQMRDPSILVLALQAYHTIIDEMDVNDLVQLFDALYKSQLSVVDQLYDPLVEKFMNQLTVE